MTELPWLDEDGEEIVELSIAELGRLLPEVLTWTDEPSARAGDMFVFRFGRTHWTDDAGRTHRVEFPDVWIRLSANPVRKKGQWHWWAPFVRYGFGSTVYMASGAGHTSSPRHSLDDGTEELGAIPLEPVREKSRAQRDRESAIRKAKSRRPGKRERQQRAA